MTENKRFIYDDFNGIFYDGKQILTNEEILDLLNKLNDENKRYKKFIRKILIPWAESRFNSKTKSNND